MPAEPEISYTASAAGLAAYGNEPDEAIANVLAEAHKPQWGKWWIYGEIKVYLDLSDDDRYVWFAEVTMQRTVEVEI